MGCSVCVAEAILNGNLSRLRQLLSLPVEYSDSVCLPGIPEATTSGFPEFPVRHRSCPASHSRYVQQSGPLSTRSDSDSLIRLALASSCSTLSLREMILSKKFDFKLDLPVIFNNIPSSLCQCSYIKLTPVMYCILFDHLEPLELLIQLAHFDLNDLLARGTNYINLTCQLSPQFEDSDLEAPT